MQNQNEVLKKIVLDNWNSQISRTTKILEGFTDEQLAHEVAPTKNSGIYLLGHLVAVHDMLIPLLNLGERLHPELDEAFIKNPDKSDLPKPSVAQLRNDWTEVNHVLSAKLATLNAENFFEKHNSVSAEDFAKEPHRNRLNVLLSRVNHLNYHIGQLVLLKR